MKVCKYGRHFVLCFCVLSLIAAFAVPNVSASSGVAAVSTVYNATLHNYNQNKCFDFDSGLELTTPNASCDLYLTGSCMPNQQGCTPNAVFNASETAFGITAMGPCKTVRDESVSTNIQGCSRLDPLWQTQNTSVGHYQSSFSFYQDEDGLAMVTNGTGSGYRYVLFVARANGSTILLDYKYQDNGSNMFGERPTSGCSAYSNETSCRNAANNGSMCYWDFNSVICLEQQEGGGDMGGKGGAGCWIFDGNQTMCGQANNCRWCASNATPGCSQLPSGQANLCEPLSEGENMINCENITNATTCAQIPMLRSCCTWNSSAAVNCQPTFTPDCHNVDPGEGKHFCDDYLAKNNQTICNQIAAFPYLMPCKWNNETSKCDFRSGDMFGGGGGNFQDIGSEQNCQAAGGTWKTQTYKYTDQYGVEKTSTDSWCEMNFGGGSQLCDNDCWACEYQEGHAGDSNYRWPNVTAATEACAGSALGFCYWETNGGENSPSANEGGAPGWCFPMQNINFGGGNCDTNCFDCFAPTLNKSKERCEASLNGCSWFWGDSSNMTGWCDGNNVKSCSQDCFLCYDTDACNNQGLGGGGNCQWDPDLQLCKPQGFSGEICFDGQDNDNDGSVDCGDSDCTFDSFCGGDVGNDCGQYMNNQGQCNSTTGCAWIQDSFCDTCFFCGREEELCFQSQNNATCSSYGVDTCRWRSQPDCDVNKSLAENCFNGSLTSATCDDGPRAAICVWRSPGGNFNCSSQADQFNCNRNPDCMWDGDSCERGGFCDFKMFACFENRDQQSCNDNSLCNWMEDFFGGPGGGEGGGHCEPICFSYNSGPGGAGPTCENETQGLCQLRGGFCEPTKFAKQDDCPMHSTESECNEYNTTCGWMTAPGGAGCDINKSMMMDVCGGKNQSVCATLASSGCAWQTPQNFFDGGGFVSQYVEGPGGPGGPGGSFCGLAVMTCFNNASYSQNRSVCESNQNCAWMFNHCEPKCFSATPDTCSTLAPQCTPVTGYCQPKMMMQMFGNMENGPPTILAIDECPETNKSAYVDICGMGIKDNPTSFGFGVGVEGISSAAICTEFSNGQSSTEFYWYLDTDGNESNNCNASYGNQTGFEFKLKYTGQISNTSQNLTEVRVAYKCMSGSWVATQIKLSSWTQKMCQDLEGAMVAVDKSDFKKLPTLYNATKAMRIYAISVDNTTNETSPADAVGPGYYRQGTADFKFEDCNAPGQDLDGDGFTSENDPDCADVKRKGYVEFEDCFPDGIDNDGNGLIDCAEPHCAPTPVCSELTNKSLHFEIDPNDKLAPKLVRYTVDRYHDMAVVKYDSDEPANGSLLFYGNISGCTTLNYTVDDLGDPDMVWDDYKPWHMGRVTGLNMNKTYYFKLSLYDPSGNPSISGCLNFTTKATLTNITLGMIYTASPGANLTANVSAYVADNNSASYTSWNYSSYGYRTVRISDGKLKFDSPTASTYWSVELLGVDVLASRTINMTGAFIENTTSNDSGNFTFIGLDGANWQDVLQNLGVEAVRMTLPKPGNISCYNMTVSHCSDNATGCKDVGNYTAPDLTSCNDTHTVWKIPITLGFSTYTVSGGPGGASVITQSLQGGWNLISIPLII